MVSEVSSPNQSIVLNDSQQKRLGEFRNAFKMKLWFVKTLPSAWFMGVRIKSITPERGEVLLPYGWRSQNPFKSIYFAAQMAAGEFSTGMLASLALEGRGKISILVTHIEADFFKKANGLVVFTCEDGAKVFQLIDEVAESNVPKTLVMVSRGVQQNNNEVVSEVRITWSFRKKS